MFFDIPYSCDDGRNTNSRIALVVPRDNDIDVHSCLLAHLNDERTARSVRLSSMVLYPLSAPWHS